MGRKIAADDLAIYPNIKKSIPCEQLRYWSKKKVRRRKKAKKENNHELRFSIAKFCSISADSCNHPATISILFLHIFRLCVHLQDS